MKKPAKKHTKVSLPWPLVILLAPLLLLLGIALAAFAVVSAVVLLVCAVAEVLSDWWSSRK